MMPRPRSQDRGIYTNPAATEMTSIDDYTVRYAAFNGWTLPELAVLNTYRRRTA